MLNSLNDCESESIQYTPRRSQRAAFVNGLAAIRLDVIQSRVRLGMSRGFGGDSGCVVDSGARVNLSESDESSSNLNFDEEYDQSSCVICSEPWSTDGCVKLVFLNCGHVYHGECISTWLGQVPQCAICRLPVKHPYPTEVCLDYVGALRQYVSSTDKSCDKSAVRGAKRAIARLEVKEAKRQAIEGERIVAQLKHDIQECVDSMNSTQLRLEEFAVEIESSERELLRKAKTQLNTDQAEHDELERGEALSKMRFEYFKAMSEIYEEREVDVSRRPQLVDWLNGTLQHFVDVVANSSEYQLLVKRVNILQQQHLDHDNKARELSAKWLHNVEDAQRLVLTDKKRKVELQDAKKKLEMLRGIFAGI